MLMILLFIQFEKIRTLPETSKKNFFYPYRKWFYDNSMVLNPGKCSYTSFDYNPDKTDSILEDSSKIPSAEEYVVLGVTLDNRLTVYNQLNP